MLLGGSGDDTVVGASGDRLTGGAGSDHFVINAGAGKQAVADFKPAVDQLLIDHHLAATFADLMSHATQSGTSTVINFDAANAVTLEQTTLSSLHSGDFFFF
jgi:Ca2+-binding RTX toxin-like protein